MKNIFKLMGVVLLIGLLAACSGNASGSDEAVPEQGETQASNQSNEDKEKESSNDNVKENKTGKLTVLHKDKSINVSAKSGPMKLDITGIRVAALEPNESYKSMFDGKDKLTVISFEIKATNTKDKLVRFYPDQATITTNTGNQVKSDMLLSDSIGGDFRGKVHKKGDIHFTLDTPAKKIKKVELYIGGADGKDYMDIGKDIKLEFKLKK